MNKKGNKLILTKMPVLLDFAKVKLGLPEGFCRCYKVQNACCDGLQEEKKELFTTLLVKQLE